MTVILVDARRPTLVPVEAVELLSQDTQYTEEMPIRIQWSLPSARSALVGPDAPVLLSSDPEHPAVKARLAAGERLIVPDRRAGERPEIRQVAEEDIASDDHPDDLRIEKRRKRARRREAVGLNEHQMPHRSSKPYESYEQPLQALWRLPEDGKRRRRRERPDEAHVEQRCLRPVAPAHLARHNIVDRTAEG